MSLPNVAYFSMEIAMDQSLSTYSGGLGFLAGSHMLSAGYLQMPMVGVTMLWSYGYYDQRIDHSGNVEVAHTHRFKKAYLRHLLKEHYEHSRYHIEGGYGYHKRQYYYNIYIKQLQPIEEQIVGAVYRECGEACGVALCTAGSVIGRISGRTAKGCNSISLKICGELLQLCEILSVGEGL